MYLKERARKEEDQREGARRRLHSLNARIAHLDSAVASASSAVQAALDESTRHVAQRALPAIGARVGERLAAKTLSEENPRGVELPELIRSWEAKLDHSVKREVAGSMGREEFVRLASSTLAEHWARRPGSVEVSHLSAEEMEEKERERVKSTLLKLGVSEEDFSAQFDEYLTAAGSQAGGLQIGPTIEAMLRAGAERKSADAALIASCHVLKNAALEQQGALRDVLSAVVLQGEQEAEAAARDAARAEEAAKGSKEALAAAAARKEAAAAAAKKVTTTPAWMAKQWDAKQAGDAKQAEEPRAPAGEQEGVKSSEGASEEGGVEAVVVS